MTVSPEGSSPGASDVRDVMPHGKPAPVVWQPRSGAGCAKWFVLKCFEIGTQARIRADTKTVVTEIENACQTW